MDRDRFIAKPGKAVRLKDFDTGYTGKFKDKAAAQRKLAADIAELARMQDVLYAQDTWALLVIFQALDAAGKDSAIEHVMTGVNPAGVQVVSFKAPSAEELDHDYLWRCTRALPERGRIGIFNRSYYEEVLVVRVYPQILAGQKLPEAARGKGVWRDRFEDINAFERYLTRNGVAIVKFFLHVSKKEQRQRFLDRINDPEKNWKFASGDVDAHQHYDDFMTAYEDAFRHTSTEWAPWYVIPADHKWFTRAAVADVLVARMKDLGLRYPKLSPEGKASLAKYKTILESES